MDLINKRSQQESQEGADMLNTVFGETEQAVLSFVDWRQEDQLEGC